jgi:hypothetical protein
MSFCSLLTLLRIMVPALIRDTKYLREPRGWYLQLTQQSLQAFQIDVYALNAYHLHIENSQVTRKA